MNTKPSTGGTGGGIEYNNGKYIEIDYNNNINLKYDDSINENSINIPTSQAVFKITKDKLDVSTFNGHVNDFNNHVNVFNNHVNDFNGHIDDNNNLHLNE